MVILIIAISLLFLLLLWCLSLHGKRKPKDFYQLVKFDYAHRGLHALDHGIPENSLRAFRFAAGNGYGAELDVHLSKDGRLVVMHDESLNRTAGLAQDICDTTAEQLDGLRLQGTKEKIPYLEEVLPLFEGKQPLVIELKPVHKNHAELTSKVCKLLHDYPQLSFCIESFDPRVLLWLKKHRPAIIRGQLSANFIKDRSGLSLPIAFLITNLMSNFLTNPHFVAYRLQDRKNLSLRLCTKLWGVQEFNWTVQSSKAAQAALQDGRIIIFEGFAP